jgi:hypothetical protein
MLSFADDEIVAIDLNESGNLIDADSGRVVPTEAVGRQLEKLIEVAADITDIFIFVHGWRNSPERAGQSVTKLAALVREQFVAQRRIYSGLDSFHGLFVLVRWPSMSNPFPWGYRQIRERAHAMTTRGYADFVIAHVLGYLNSVRELPSYGPPTLRTRKGQYLHCIGHSFGGRFLCEAIMAAADPTAPTLAWPWKSEDYPYTVDTLLVFQMATQPGDFAGRYSALLGPAPISGPIVLTFSRADRALGLWHRFAEGCRGLGSRGATAPADAIQRVRLPRMDERLIIRPDRGRIVNVDSTWRFNHGRFLRPEGAHSDIWYPESANLLLSLADEARP